MTQFFNQRQKSIVLIIASNNVHKIRECKSILSQFPHLDILTLLDFPDYVAPEETGQTFEENAIIKATHAAKTLNHWALADDSGLVVPALKGAPGVYSARYAGKEATDMDNRKKLIAAMKDFDTPDRHAYFECVIALSSPEGLKKCAHGSCEGEIVDREKGGGGFGYDPLFMKHEYSKTFAELEESIKNRISHRRKALDKILLSLETIGGN